MSEFTGSKIDSKTQVLENIYEVIAGNTQYMTQKEFTDSLESICIDYDAKTITLEHKAMSGSKFVLSIKEVKE